MGVDPCDTVLKTFEEELDFLMLASEMALRRSRDPDSDLLFRRLGEVLLGLGRESTVLVAPSSGGCARQGSSDWR